MPAEGDVNSHHGSFFKGVLVERSYLNKQLNISDGATDAYDASFQCLPCAIGCINCTSDDPCFAEYDAMLRCIPLGIQSFCITVTAVVAFVVARMRKTKVSAAFLPVRNSIARGAVDVLLMLNMQVWLYCIKYSQAAYFFRCVSSHFDMGSMFF